MMLQQTQVARVIDCYRAFLRRFPTVRALARANEQDVLALWQGLGYYRRARNLHLAAKMIVDQFGGRFPRIAIELGKLPGVGRYTAGAISSIVFGEHEAAVDGNVQRVLARWFAHQEDPHDLRVNEWTWKTANDLAQSARRPGVFNEALMDLGAVVCLPRSPRCDACPVAKLCQARVRNLQHEIPPAAKRAKPQAAHHHAVILTRNGKVLLEQRHREGMWAGMWQTPTIESDRRLSLIEIKHLCAFSIVDIGEAGSFEHHTTHRQIQFHIYRASSRVKKGLWKNPKEIEMLPMGSAQRRVLGFVGSNSQIGCAGNGNERIRKKGP